MTAVSDSAADRSLPPESILFSATLHAHRSLGRLGTWLVLGFIGIVSITLALPFVILGAWPIGGFFGLDFAILYLCFRINNARARAYEEVVLRRIELLIRKVSWRGERTEQRFNPFWVRLRAEEDADFGVLRLAVVQRAEEIEIGAALAPHERADFARAFGRALADARR
ncbi:MAG: DUF2244 domain-containing protein [Proteobacteria bacterium]|nr:DUF2244 domain-containing protein [Pseudomonadota bacterium]